MDRFKFRARRLDNNNFVYGYLCFIYIDNEKHCRIYSLDDVKSYDCYTETLGQCTGLKDKNDKLIYEGDIVREVSIDEDSAMGAEYEEVSVVCFGGGDYPYSFTLKHPRFYRGYALLNYGYMRQEIEVIGNIHENKDLIKEQD